MTRRITGGLTALVLVALLTLGVASPRGAAADPPVGTASQELSLLTETPEEGFALAITLSRRGVTETQPDRDVLHALRPGYAHDAESLIAVSHVIAVHFQTVATANNYWR
jgi:hypothetical protein